MDSNTNGFSVQIWILMYAWNTKPPQLNLVPSHLSGSRQLHTAPHQLPASTPMPFPYYQAPYVYFPQQSWPKNPHSVPSTSQLVSPHQNPSSWPKSVKGPAISTWLQYCNNHPNHGGDNLAALATNFKPRVTKQLINLPVDIYP